MQRYSKRHYEDVAKLLRSERDAGLDALGNNQGSIAIACVMMGFANLFAADSPVVCVNCADGEGSTAICTRPNEGHNFTGGFDRARFLLACGIEGS